MKSKLHSLTDEALMVQLMDHHSHPALQELHRRYAQRLLGFFFRMLNKDAQLAQDCVQEMFLKLMEKKHLYDPGRKLEPWLFTLAANHCKTIYRRYGRTVDLDLHAAVLVERVDDNLEKSDFSTSLNKALDNLPDIHKEVFVLRFLEHFSLQEIVEISGISLGTVKSRLFNATRKIAVELKDFDPSYETQLFKIH